MWTKGKAGTLVERLTHCHELRQLTIDVLSNIVIPHAMYVGTWLMHKNSKVIKIMLTASMHIICERDCMVIDRLSFRAEAH